MGWRVMGTTRSYACATQAGLTRLGSKVMRTSRVVLPLCARRATLVSLLPWCRVLQGLSALQGCPKKPIPIAGAQWCAWNTRRKLSHHVGHFVGSVTIPPCGVPASVGWNACVFLSPALHHFQSTPLSIGTWVRSPSGLLVSKQDVTSPSKPPCADPLRARMLEHGIIASAVDRSFLHPEEFGAA